MAAKVVDDRLTWAVIDVRSWSGGEGRDAGGGGGGGEGCG